MNKTLLLTLLLSTFLTYAADAPTTFWLLTNQKAPQPPATADAPPTYEEATEAVHRPSWDTIKDQIYWGEKTTANRATPCRPEEADVLIQKKPEMLNQNKVCL